MSRSIFLSKFILVDFRWKLILVNFWTKYNFVSFLSEAISGNFRSNLILINFGLTFLVYFCSWILICYCSCVMFHNSFVFVFLLFYSYSLFYFIFHSFIYIEQDFKKDKSKIKNLISKQQTIFSLENRKFIYEYIVRMFFPPPLKILKQFADELTYPEEYANV